MTYFPGGRLGNMLTTYLTLYWLKLEFGYDTYYEKEAYYVSTTFTTFLWKHIQVRFPILDIPTYTVWTTNSVIVGAIWLLIKKATSRPSYKS